MNTVNLKIDNCMNCPHHFTDGILTADPFEHEKGCFCSKVRDEKNYECYGQYYKLVAADDWHLEKYTQVPDWCPLLTENKYME